MGVRTQLEGWFFFIFGAVGGMYIKEGSPQMGGPMEEIANTIGGSELGLLKQSSGYYRLAAV